jgi:hypothetical protein
LRELRISGIVQGPATSITLPPLSLEVSMPTVLIVDDEQHIRLLIGQTLEELEDEAVASGAPLSSCGRPDDDSTPAR